VVDANFRGIVFVPQDQTRDLNLSLARDLNLSLARDLVRFGGRICLIGPAGPHMQNADWCSLPSASPTLAPIFEIVPLQAATFQFAILRGIEPGSFRYAPQVAVNEASFSQH
jgi:glucosamine--fructose-6-phosphate aminotransferase (isomerizing)